MNKKFLLIYSLFILIITITIDFNKDIIYNYLEKSYIKKDFKTIEFLKKGELKEGDIVFVANNAIVSNILQSVDSDFPYTHTGVIVNYEGKLVVLNIDAKKFFERQAISLIELKGFIETGSNFAIYRLKEDFDLPMFHNTVDNFIKYKKSYYFDWFASLNNNALYCVELIRKIYLKQNINITKEAKIKRNGMEMFFPSDIDLNKFTLIIKEENVN